MKNRSIDPWPILTSALLIVFGLVMVYSASAMVAFERSGDEAYYLTRQLIALAVGLVLCATTVVTPMRVVRRYRGFLYGAVLFGLILCFVLAFDTEQWSLPMDRFWARPLATIGIAKIIVLIMLADYLDTYRRQIADSAVVLKSISGAAASPDAHPPATRFRHHGHHRWALLHHGLYGWIADGAYRGRCMWGANYWYSRHDLGALPRAAVDQFLDL